MIKNIAIVIFAVVLAGFVFAGIKALDFYHAIYKPSLAVNVNKKAVPTKPKTSYNILLLGYGGPGHDGAYLTDTMMVAHVDLTKKEMLMVSIPRDIWVSLPTKSGTPFHAKINTLYQDEKYPDTFPDIQTNELVHNKVQEITGLLVDNTVTIDFSGFKKAIDILGGININVKKSFTDKEYPVDGHEDDACGKDMNDPEIQKQATDSPTLVFPCRYETLHFDTGPQVMNGETALKFVRSRHGDFDGGDFGRAARQQQFVEGLREKLTSINVITSLTPLLDDLKTHITMDIDQQVLGRFLGEAGHIKDYKINHLVMSDNDYLDFGTSDDGQSILQPKAGKDDWTDVKTWISNSIASITPTPTKAPITPTVKP